MQVNYTGLLGPLRWGVGKLVCDARKYTDRCAGAWLGAAASDLLLSWLLPLAVGARGARAFPMRACPAPPDRLQGPSGASLLPQRHGQRAAQARPPTAQRTAGAGAQRRGGRAWLCCACWPCAPRPRVAWCSMVQAPAAMPCLPQVRVVVGEPLDLSDLTCRCAGLAGWCAGWHQQGQRGRPVNAARPRPRELCYVVVPSVRVRWLPRAHLPCLTACVPLPAWAPQVQPGWGGPEACVARHHAPHRRRAARAGAAGAAQRGPGERRCGGACRGCSCGLVARRRAILVARTACSCPPSLHALCPRADPRRAAAARGGAAPALGGGAAGGQARRGGGGVARERRWCWGSRSVYADRCPRRRRPCP